MTKVHRIRLRGPWSVTALAGPDGNTRTDPATMTCPCSWREGGWPHFHGRALHVRRFGRPSKIGAGERVWLVIDPCRGELSIELNGTRIGSAGVAAAFEFDCTDRLSLRNEVAITVTGKDDRCGLTGEVRLEIRSESSISETSR